MKKYFLFGIMLMLSLMLVGCDGKLDSIPKDAQGFFLTQSGTDTSFISRDLKTYWFYELSNNTLRKKVCVVGYDGQKWKTEADCNFDDGKVSDQYTIKEIEKNSKKINFELYKNIEKKYYCKYENDRIYCEDAKSGHYAFSASRRKVAGKVK